MLTEIEPLGNVVLEVLVVVMVGLVLGSGVGVGVSLLLLFGVVQEVVKSVVVMLDVMGLSTEVVNVSTVVSPANTGQPGPLEGLNDASTWYCFDRGDKRGGTYRADGRCRVRRANVGANRACYEGGRRGRRRQHLSLNSPGSDNLLIRPRQRRQCHALASRHLSFLRPSLWSNR